jgi:hypothetical protein
MSINNYASLTVYSHSYSNNCSISTFICNKKQHQIIKYPMLHNLSANLGLNIACYKWNNVDIFLSPKYGVPSFYCNNSLYISKSKSL